MTNGGELALLLGLLGGWAVLFMLALLWSAREADKEAPTSREVDCADGHVWTTDLWADGTPVPGRRCHFCKTEAD